MQEGEEVVKYTINNQQLMKLCFDLIFSETEELRVLSSLCFKQYCYILRTKEQLDDLGYLTRIASVLDDKSDKVKINVLLGLLYFGNSRYGIDTLVANKLLEKVILKLKGEESLEIYYLLLSLHEKLLHSKAAPEISLDNEIIKVLNKFIDMENIKIQEITIKNFGSLSFGARGKQACIESYFLIKMTSFTMPYRNLRLMDQWIFLF